MSGGSSSYSSLAKKQLSAEDAIMDDQYDQGNLSAESYLVSLRTRLSRAGMTPLQIQTLTEKIRNVQVDVTDAAYSNAYQKGDILTGDMYGYEKAKLDKMTEPGSQAYIKQEQKVQGLLDKAEREARSDYRREQMLKISQMPEDTSDRIWQKAQLYDQLEQQARADGDSATADSLATQKNNYMSSAKRADINDLITGTKLQVSETFGAGTGVPSAEGGVGLYSELTGGKIGITSPAIKNALESLDRQKMSLDRLYQNRSDKENMIETYRTAIAAATGDQKTQLTIAFNNLQSDITNIDNQIANTTQNITDQVYKIQDINTKAAGSAFNQEVRKNNSMFDKAETDIENEFKKGKIDKIEYITKGIELAQAKAQFYEQASGGFSQFGNEASADSYMEKTNQAINIHESLINIAQNLDDYEPVFVDKDSNLTNLFGEKIRKGDVVLQDVRQLKDSGRWSENYAKVDGTFHRIQYDQLPPEYLDADGFLLSGISSDKNFAKLMNNAYVYTVKDGKVGQEGIRFLQSDDGIEAVTETRANKLVQDGAVIKNEQGGLIWKPQMKESGLLKAAAKTQEVLQNSIPGYAKYVQDVQAIPQNLKNIGQKTLVTPVKNVMEYYKNFYTPIVQKGIEGAKNIFEKGKEFASTAINKAKDVFRGMNIFNPPEVSGKEGLNSPYADAIGSAFGQEAADAIRVLKGENVNHDAQARNKNNDGSEDRGLFQINSNTFNDFWNRKQNLLRQNGINNYNDMYDPVKNARMAKIIKDEQGWKAWYGAPEELRYGTSDKGYESIDYTIPDLKTRNIELALGLKKGTYQKGMKVDQAAVDRAYRSNDQQMINLLKGEGFNATPEPTPISTPRPSTVNGQPIQQQSSGWSMPKIDIPQINIPQISQNLSQSAQKATTAVKNYFTPTSNQGNNFWSTPVASGLANVQSSIQKYTAPVVNKVQQTVSNVKNWFSNLFKK